MKKLIFIFAFVFLFCEVCLGAAIILNWDANSETDLAGYKIYYSTTTACADSSAECDDPTGPYSGTEADQGDSPVTVNLTDLSDSANPEYTITGLDDTKTYYFAVTAFDNEATPLESGYSNQIELKYKTNGSPAKPNLIKAFWQIITSFFKNLKARWS